MPVVALSTIAGVALLLAPALEAQIPVQGVVLDAGGAGSAGVVVELRRLPDHHHNAVLLLTGRARVETLATSRSRPDGRFAVAAPGAGVYRVTLRAPERVAMHYLFLPLVEPAELPPVRLAPRARSTLEVRDARGEPVAGAGVFAESADAEVWRPWGQGGWHPETRLAWTGEDGRAHLPRLDGERLDVRVVVPGRLDSPRVEGIDDARIELPPAPEGLELELRGADDAPLAGALVALAELGWPVGRTDAGGRLPSPDRPELARRSSS